MHFTWCIKTVLEISFTCKQTVISMELSFYKCCASNSKDPFATLLLKLSFVCEEEWRIFYQVDLDTIFLTNVLCYIFPLSVH